MYYENCTFWLVIFPVIIIFTLSSANMSCKKIGVKLLSVIPIFKCEGWFGYVMTVSASPLVIK